MNDTPRSIEQERASMVRVREIRDLRFQHKISLADKDDEFNRVFSEVFSEEDAKEFCRKQSAIAPVTLVRRPRVAWTEVDFQ